MNVAILAFSALSFITSAATLAVVLTGGKKVQQEVEQLKGTSNDAIDAATQALQGLKF